MNSLQKERLNYLLTQVRSEAATQAEYKELLGVLNAESDQEEIQADIREYFDEYCPVVPSADPAETSWQLILQQVLAADKPMVAETVIPKSKVRKLRWMTAAAAIVLVALGTFFWINVNRDKRPSVAVKPSESNDIAPGKNGAVLQLADGSKVSLDLAANGVVAAQGGSQAIMHNGQLKYEKGKLQDDNVFNTLTTPRGRIFNVVLSDGTRVWLNAASSLRYPTRFAGSRRVVEVSGEAYFDVAHNQNSPFIVQIINASGKSPASVEVLGTTFNINAYAGDSHNSTTLLDGAVRIIAGNSQLVLKPGQQSTFDHNGNAQLAANPDLQEVLSWKNGIFSFENKSSADIFRELSRWYDIDVVYENGVPNIDIGGKMSRDVSLSVVLTFLKDSGLKCRLDADQKKLFIQ
ncbi:FecR domain-containing protein [Chitinophagaceae bacterium 26-R-25]|nr:FecR domain-containing protein [Chitinophagaceae bacterium 26-R-25]